MNKYLLTLFCFIFYFGGNAQSWQDTVTMIEKIFDRYKPNMPGCQLAISKNGNVVYSRAWGMADLEHNVPLSTESIIEAGSVSKQFTAAAILLLEQQGKLSLKDDVHKYIPELPDYGTPILLQQMMQHTSGLKDWGSVAGVSGWPRTTKTYDNNDALYIICRQKTLNHKPGAEYLYSNSNYNLFAIIVERVSGISLAEYTRKNIFEPAGMKHTEWRNNFKKIVSNRAIAYSKASSGYETDMPNEYVYGNGGLLTTAEDLLIWNNYYLNGKLGTPSLLPKQLELVPFNNGVLNRYGAGLRVDSSRGWKIIAHTGATASYRSSLEYYPDLGLSIAWLSNSSEFDGSSNAAEAVSNLLVKNLSSASSKNSTAEFAIAADKLKSYEGWYKDSRTAGGVKLFIKDGKLANSRGGTLIPVSDNAFLLGSNRIEVQSKPKRILLIAPVDTVYFEAVDSARTDENYFKEFAGEFYSDETESKFKVLTKDGKLIVHRDPTTDYTLTPLYKDAFAFPGGSVFFERDKKERVSKMRVYVGRARNIEFQKLNIKS